MKKIFGFLFLAGIVGMVAFYMLYMLYMLYNKPHRNPADETSIQITSKDLFDKFNADEMSANALFLDNVLEVKGKVLEVTANQDQMTVIVLETNDPIFGIRCSMSSTTEISPSDLVIVQGICTGYLSDVIITNAFLKEKIE
ncbi:MAG: hypothetical protein JNM78_11360 [Cyclobacteriaceae bacterium]|nr:hypothetical protein [Cyclobacteriaceae bacterium]